MIYLQKFEANTLAIKIYNTYGLRFMESRGKPYRLAEDIDGIGFAGG
ncbi:MAG: helix-hairpin-helix domain-containing protein [Eisenbergiella sp.]